MNCRRKKLKCTLVMIILCCSISHSGAMSDHIDLRIWRHESERGGDGGVPVPGGTGQGIRSGPIQHR